MHFGSSQIVIEVEKQKKKKKERERKEKKGKGRGRKKTFNFKILIFSINSYMKLLVYIITNSYIHTRVIIHICNVQLVYMYRQFLYNLLLSNQSWQKSSRLRIVVIRSQFP